MITERHLKTEGFSKVDNEDLNIVSYYKTIWLTEDIRYDIKCDVIFVSHTASTLPGTFDFIFYVSLPSPTNGKMITIIIDQWFVNSGVYSGCTLEDALAYFNWVATTHYSLLNQTV